MNSKQHWNNVYAHKSSESLSWFQPHAEISLSLIEQLRLDPSSGIIDIGGGTSTLIDDLLALGYNNLSVLDLSGEALKVAQSRLGKSADRVRWLEEDVTQLKLEKHSIDLWHDRAVFHFLTSEQDRQKYVDAVLHAVKPGGHVIIATFAEDGPEKCSGLNIERYSPDTLHAEFGSPFQLLGHKSEQHVTPGGKSQSFVYCYCQKNMIS